MTDLTTLTTATDAVTGRIDNHRDRLLEISHTIHANPELAFNEHDSANLVAEELRAAGFDVTVGVYGLDTAIEATYGSGDFVVTVCAEYDALPGIGHACGHNIIATAGLGAALGLAEIADAAGIRVKLLGTPAEEHGGGKVLMLREGAWEDATISLMVHGGPGVTDARCGDFTSQAVDRFKVTYTGTPAHAAAAPQNGVNALDAATVALTSIGLLRQQLDNSVRVAGVVTDGGDVTNIIPDHTEIDAEVRAFDMDILEDAKRRVMNCFEAGALASGCSWSVVETEPRYASLVQDPTLADAWNTALTDLGRDVTAQPGSSGGSTDMGNVSQVVPSIHPMIALLGTDAPPHTTGFAAAAATPAGDDAAIVSAKGLALAAATVALTPETRGELLARQAARPVGATTVES
ncbi:M20 family metallopeptidase [Corynebacterium glyciniphilum]|uniref:M20 family metallopeptidase n=1 Tax=Corynebacterium glyciniphilum TaxID=1404244 RepID=UPI003FD3AF12